MTAHGRLKDKVAIIGMGCTKFGELWDKDGYDLVIDSAYEAYDDAGIDPKQIQAAWVGTVLGSTATQLSVPLKTDYIPVFSLMQVFIENCQTVQFTGCI